MSSVYSFSCMFQAAVTTTDADDDDGDKSQGMSSICLHFISIRTFKMSFFVNLH